MPEQPQQEVTSFKTRTHHGSGQKETYDLKACVYLEDARPANDRSVEAPREMRLSLLRWDCPDEESGQPQPQPQHQLRGGDAADAPSNASGGGGGGRIEPTSSLEGRGDGGRGSLSERDDGRPRGVKRCADGRSEGDRSPGDQERPMREEVWMLCNLDEHLLFSQFHVPPEEKMQQQLPVPAIDGVMSSNPNFKQPDWAPEIGATVGRDSGGWRGGEAGGGDSNIRENASASARSSRPLLPPSIKQPVMRRRREERVTFHARPTCHDFLRGWEGGRARAGIASPSRRRRRPRAEEGTAPSAAVDATTNRDLRGCQDGVARNGGGGRGSGAGSTRATKGDCIDGKGSGGGGGAAPGSTLVDRIVAVGFKSGECAVLDATTTNSPSFISVLNKGGAYCEGRVMAVRFVPGAGQRLFVAAFSTGDAYTFDISLSKEAPMGAAAEKAAADAASATGVSNGGGSGGGAGGGGSIGTGGGASGRRRGPNGKGWPGWGGGGTAGKTSQDSIGSSNGGGSWSKSRSDHGTSSSSSSGGSSSAPPLPASFTAGGGNGKSDGSGSGGGKHGRGGSSNNNRGVGVGSKPAGPCDRGGGLFVEMNSVVGANPVSRWKVASDGREITAMAFAPCQVDGRRLVALAALDGRVRVVDYDEQVLVAGFKSWFGGLLCLDWSPDGRYIVTGGEDDAVSLWCVETRTCVLRGEGHGSWVTGVAFDYWTSRRPYYRFTSVGEDARLCMWEHDEMAGSLLHGVSGGLRRAPPNIKHRYKSSENLGQRSKSSESLGRSSDSRSSASVSRNSKSSESLSRNGGSVAMVATEWATKEGDGEGAAGAVERMPNRAMTLDKTSSVSPGEHFGVGSAWPKGSNPSNSRLGRSAAAAAQQAAAAATPTPEARQATAAAASTTSGGGRGPLSLPSRGVMFFGGAARGSRVASSGGNPAAAGTGGGSRRGKSAGGSSGRGEMADGRGGEAGVGKENCGGSGMSFAYPAVSRQSTPRGEPLCCKRLAQVPLSQVMVVRAGVVTLCAEGLLKLWARPTVPPPLPLLRMDGTDCGGDKGGGSISCDISGAGDGQHEEAGTASPSLPSSSLLSSPSPRGKVASSTGNAAGDSAAVQNATSSSAPSSTNPGASPGAAATVVTAATTAELSAGGSSKANSSVDTVTPLSPAALDALINTDIHTPRPDGSAVAAGTNEAANGKKKGFFSKGIFSKTSAGRNSSGSGGGGAMPRHDVDHNPGFSALSAANAKGRDPPSQLKGQKSASPPHGSAAASASSGTALGSAVVSGRGTRG